MASMRSIIISTAPSFVIGLEFDEEEELEEEEEEEEDAADDDDDAAVPFNFAVLVVE